MTFLKPNIFKMIIIDFINVFLVNNCNFGLFDWLAFDRYWLNIDDTLIVLGFQIESYRAFVQIFDSLLDQVFVTQRVNDDVERVVKHVDLVGVEALLDGVVLGDALELVVRVLSGLAQQIGEVAVVELEEGDRRRELDHLAGVHD